jgi:uncharacterized protein (DUF1330 family)
MPEAYVFVTMKVNDMEKYKEYMATAPTAVKAFGGEYVVRGGRYETVEGEFAPARIAILKFPSFETAKTFYDSEQYRAARAKRAGTTEYFNMTIVEGVGAPV